MDFRYTFQDETIDVHDTRTDQHVMTLSRVSMGRTEYRGWLAESTAASQIYWLSVILGQLPTDWFHRMEEPTA
ncbi:hypothetical protein [Salininema proteolyticum]|uniref:Uncharacterized protein n=1 Tax=Salininema proteolyticum TaxID=1607685 RepID=A0ABV8U2B6_9ACTN